MSDLSSQKFNVGDVGTAPQTAAPYYFFVAIPEDYWKEHASAAQMAQLKQFSETIGKVVTFLRIGAEGFAFECDSAQHCSRLVSLFDEKAFNCFNYWVSSFLLFEGNPYTQKVIETLRLCYECLLDQSDRRLNSATLFELVEVLKKHKPTAMPQ